MTSRRTRIYEGKAKILYEGPEPGTVIVHFKDDATAFDAQKKAVIEGKGVLNQRISEYIFSQPQRRRHSDPFHARPSICVSSSCAKLKSFPSKSLCAMWRRARWRSALVLRRALALPRSIIEFCYKNDALG